MAPKVLHDFRSAARFFGSVEQHGNAGVEFELVGEFGGGVARRCAGGVGDYQELVRRGWVGFCEGGEVGLCMHV